MTRITTSIFIILIMCCVSCARQNRWEKLPIGIAVNTDEDLAVLDLYNDIFDFEIFVEDPDGVPINLIENAEDYSSSDGIIGVTNVDYSGGYISSAVIYLEDRWTGKNHDKLLAHELAHVLGIMHHIQGTILNHTTIGNVEIDELIMKDEFMSAVEELYPEYFQE